MEYTLTDSGTCRKRVDLAFSPEDITAAFDESYREINDYVKIKGFRKGKAPRRTLESRFAKEAASGVRQQLTETHLQEIIKKEEIALLGDVASPDKNPALPQPGKPYAMYFEFNIVPAFELPEYKGLDLPKPDVSITDDAVAAELENLRKSMGSFEPAADGDAAAVGDIIHVDFETKVDGQEIMSMENQRLRVDGDMLFGLPCPELVTKFTGARKGDFVQVGVTLPDDHPNPELRNRDAVVELTVKSVERGKYPELDEDFAKNLGLGGLEQLRETLRSKLMRDAIVEAKQKEEDAIITSLLEKAVFDVPADIVAAETNALVEQQRAHLLRAGVKPGEAMDAQMEKYRPEAAKEALKKVRWSILCRKIAEKEGIQVTNDDLANQVEALARNYGMPPAKIIQRIREFDGVGPMMAEIQSMKVIRVIENSAKGRGEGTDTANLAAVESAKDISAE